MRIVIPGIDASQSGLGQSAPLIHGLPGSGLRALYFYNSGTIGQAVTTFPDLSGKGNHATIYGTFAAPTQRAWGLEVQSVHGLVLSTGVPLGPQATVILAVASLIPGGETNVYQTFFSPSSNALPTNPALSQSHNASPVLNFDGNLAANVGTYGVLDGTTGRVVLGTPRVDIVGGPKAAAPAVLTVRIDTAASVLRLASNIGTERVVSRPEIAAHYGTSRGTVMLGAWGNSTFRTAATPNARLFGAAIYDRTLTTEEITRAMRAIRRPAELAGIVFAG